MRLKQTRMKWTFVLLLLAMANRASAGTVYDAAADFSLTSNPNGVWSYGTTGTTPTGPLTLFTTIENNTGTVPFLDGWVGSESRFGDNFPAVVKNISGSTQSAFDVVMLPHELAETPAPDGAYAIVRFTAPTSGMFQLNTTFEGREFAPNATTTDVHVLLNGSSLFAGAVNGFGPSSDQSFAASLNLKAGDHIDFAVGYGSNGNFNGDLTGLVATLSTVPEPSSAVLAGVGILCLLGLRRTKRLSCQIGPRGRRTRSPFDRFGVRDWLPAWRDEVCGG